MLDENKFNQYGFPREVKDILGITIHETGNEEMNAQELFDYLNTECKTSQGCSYICDDIKTIQVMPDDYAVYHTGKGKDWGCRYTIAIEICSNINNDKYKKAQDNCVKLIKDLQKKYGIGNNSIFFHQSFNEKMYCPKTILNNYGSVQRFVIEELQEE